MDYANGKIYKLVSNVIPDIYIGSTCTELKKRKHSHKQHYKSWKNGLSRYITSFKLFDVGGVEIVLIESFPCASKDELFARERFWIENTVCVNKNIPGRTVSEYHEQNRDVILEYQKEWYEENKEKISKQHKEYREDNKEQISEQKKEYYEQNKDKILEQQKEYYEKTKDKLSEKVTCEICGKEVSRGGLARHQKSKKCISRKTNS